MESLIDEQQQKSSTISEECFDCSLKSVGNVCRFTGIDESLFEDIRKVAEKVLEESKTKPLLVQHVTRRVADAIIKVKKLPEFYDLYKEVKALSNELAVQALDSIRENAGGTHTLEEALKIAAAGNIIDFGARDYRSINIEKELGELYNTGFGHYDIDMLKDRLSRSRKLLYLCDNCGEIVFDKYVIEILKSPVPLIWK